MTLEELLKVFDKHFASAEELDQTLAQLTALQDVEIANAQAGLAQAGARQATDAANAAVAQAMSAAEAAKARFAELVAQAAAG